MSDEGTASHGGRGKRYDCPEHFCIQAFRPQEMVAHLQWDHGYSEFKAERIVERDLDVELGENA